MTREALEYATHEKTSAQTANRGFGVCRSVRHDRVDICHMSLVSSLRGDGCTENGEERRVSQTDTKRCIGKGQGVADLYKRDELSAARLS